MIKQKKAAKLILDTVNHLITFNSKGINISYSVSPNIILINSIDTYDKGYFVIQTNKGEEYIDLLGMLEVEKYEMSYIQRVKGILKDLKLDGIILINE